MADGTHAATGAAKVARTAAGERWRWRAGRELRRLREAAGLGQREAAARLHVSPGYLAEIERGPPCWARRRRRAGEGAAVGDRAPNGAHLRVGLKACCGRPEEYCPALD